VQNYIFIKKSHRASNPKNKDYESFEKYKKKMLEDHGLAYEPLSPFKKVNEKVSIFRVEDASKAMSFVFLFSEHIEKPEERRK